MSKSFKLEIVTPDRLIFSDEIASLVVPAADGYLGVLAGHAPLLCTLKPGEITLKSNGNRFRYTTSGGFMEVTPEKTIILSDSSEDVNAIDMERALQAKERARERLHKRERDVNLQRAGDALDRAENRLRIAEKRRHSEHKP